MVGRRLKIVNPESKRNGESGTVRWGPGKTDFASGDWLGKCERSSSWWQPRPVFTFCDCVSQLLVRCPFVLNLAWRPFCSDIAALIHTLPQRQTRAVLPHVPATMALGEGVCINHGHKPRLTIVPPSLTAHSVVTTRRYRARQAAGDAQRHFQKDTLFRVRGKLIELFSATSSIVRWHMPLTDNF